MRVVVAHAPDGNLSEIRRQMLGAGLDCGTEDCVGWDKLSERLAHRDAELVVVQTREHPDLPWGVVREARDLVGAPVLAIGPIENDRLAKQARKAGVMTYLDEADLRNELDAVLDGLRRTGTVSQPNGKLISVWAPSPGSGGATVAVNLAGALAASHGRQIGLIELVRETGSAAMLLNATPAQTIRDLCQRWQSLDTLSIENSLVEHQSGLRLLVNPADPSTNEFLTVDAVRRICLLAKVTLPFTVAAVDSRISEEQLEAMRLSDQVVFVVRPDVPAVRRARWAIDAAVAGNVVRDKFRLVVNRWGQRGQLNVRQIESALELTIARLIPDDPSRVNAAANQGILLQELSQQARISRRFSQLAASLNGKSQAKKKALWSWMLG